MNSSNQIGILCHLSSLPRGKNQSELRKNLKRWIDYLASIHVQYWQILPLNPVTKEGSLSPYSSSSAFALNDQLFVFKNSPLKNQKKFEQFCRKHQGWLEDYAIFVVLAERFKTTKWLQWPRKFQDPQLIAPADLNRLESRIQQVKIKQFEAHEFWREICQYAHKKKIKIIGDLPFYVSLNSADVWAHPELFKLNKAKRPEAVAGVPPDYFSKTGQLWGNPIYDWKNQTATLIKWWEKRLMRNIEIYDLVRLDHFRAFVSYWEVPAKYKTAKNGKWVPFPHQQFFKKMTKKFNFAQLFIAEDLGQITPAVDRLIAKLRIPNMKVFQFGFSGNVGKNSHYYRNLTKKSVYYSGTHDNNTLQGWMRTEASQVEKQKLKEENLFHHDNHAIIKSILQTKAQLKIFPVQDLLNLNQTARMNTPGTIKNNWKWKLSAAHLKQLHIKRNEFKQLFS